MRLLLPGLLAVASACDGKPGAAGAASGPLDTYLGGLTSKAQSQKAPHVVVTKRVKVDPPENLDVDGQSHPAPIVAIFMVSPTVLCIALDDLKVHSFAEDLDWDDKGDDAVHDYHGDVWERGPWKLTRADGKPLEVVSVWRDSLPHGSNYSDYGWGADAYANLVDFRHYLYLTLSEPLGSRETLGIRGPRELDYRWQFDDARVQTPVIQVNQIGYAPTARRRYAYVSWWMGSGGPLPLSSLPTSVEVLGQRLPLAARPSSQDAGTPVAEIDLSSLPPGREFQLRLPGVGVSYATEISDRSVLRSFYVIARGLFHNRFGRDTRAQFTDWVRPADTQRHIWTAEEPNYGKKFNPGQAKTGKRTLRGGHHDAGDFDVRPMHYQVATLLMEAYELNPQAFTDGQLSVPESGNGIPDLLDEALYSVRGWEDLQEEDGGVRLGIEATRHPWGLTFADEDPMDYWTYARDPKHSLRVAALFARAARLVAPFDAPRSVVLVQRALRAYDYAMAHGSGDGDLGRVLFASGELWRVTQEPRFKQQFERVWQANSKWGKGVSIQPGLLWQGAFGEAAEPVIGPYVLGYITAPGADPTIVQQARTLFGRQVNTAIAELERQGHRHGRPPGKKPSWGFDTAAIHGVLPCVWLLRSGVSDPRCVDALSLARDYALGGNPMSMVWFTGLGERHVIDPRHADSRAFRLKDRAKPAVDASPAVPGIPVYGPTSQLKGSAGYRYAGRLTSPPINERPLLRRFGDNNFWISSNEHDVVHHALQVLSMAISVQPNVPLDPRWLPKGARQPEH